MSLPRDRGVVLVRTSVGGHTAYRCRMITKSPHPHSHTARRHPLGLSFWALVGLASVAVPRVILHDLHIIEEGNPIAWILAIGPVALWIAVAVVKRVPNPFLTVLVIGAIFGVMLVVTHQLLWEVNYQGNPPSIGTGPAGPVIPRIAALVSGLFTGAIIGAIGGLIAWGVQAISGRAQR